MNEALQKALSNYSEYTKMAADCITFGRPDADRWIELAKLELERAHLIIRAMQPVVIPTPPPPYSPDPFWRPTWTVTTKDTSE